MNNNIIMTNDDFKDLKECVYDLRDRLVRIESKLPEGGFQCPVHTLKIEQHDKAIEELKAESKSNTIFKTKTAIYFAIIFFFIQTAISIGISWYSKADTINPRKPISIQQTNHTNNLAVK
jgi:hypothetical protein